MLVRKTIPNNKKPFLALLVLELYNKSKQKFIRVHTRVNYEDIMCIIITTIMKNVDIRSHKSPLDVL